MVQSCYIEHHAGIVVSRALTDRLDAASLELIFTKMFRTVKKAHPNFEVGKTLQGIIMDWSDAERKAVSGAVGEAVAERVCKGCKELHLRFDTLLQFTPLLSA